MNEPTDSYRVGSASGWSRPTRRIVVLTAALSVTFVLFALPGTPPMAFLWSLGGIAGVIACAWTLVVLAGRHARDRTAAGRHDVRCVAICLAVVSTEVLFAIPRALAPYC